MKPSLWVSPDARRIIVLDKVAAVRPEGLRGDVLVLLRGGRVYLDPANAKHFKAAFLRFHMPEPSTPNRTKKQS